MEKTKIERFIEEHDLQVEIVINKSNSSVFIYDKNDLYIHGYTKTTLHEAIDTAVLEHLRRKNNDN